MTTNDPAHATASIGLSVTPTGATLAWDATSPTAASFGTQPEGLAATPISLTLDNTGNATANVTFAAPGGMFTLSPTSGGITAGSNQILAAGFTPTNLVAQQASSAFTVSGAVCGTSVTALGFTGQGATGSVTGWPTATFDFGFELVRRKQPLRRRRSPLTNAGGLAAHVQTVTFGGYAGYTSSATAGTVIPANGMLVVSVSAPSIPFPSAVPGNYAGTVTYTTDIAGDTPHQVNLTEAALGAIIAFDTTATPGFGNFGPVPVGSTATENFSVVNTGNASSSVTVADTTPFSVTTAVFNLSGTSSQSDQAAFAPSTSGLVNSTLAVTATNLCQPLPTALNLSGTGEAGGISITNPPTPFTVACNSTAPAQTFTITNSGNQPMTWGGALSSTNSANGTWYSIVPAGATLPAGGSSMVMVTPVAMPQFPTDPTNLAQFNDTIVVTTDIPGDTAHNVTLSETPLGDVLVLNTASFTFGSTPINTPETAPFTITNNANNGSPQANVTITSQGADSADFTVAPSTESIAAGATTGNVNVTFQAATAATYTGDIAIGSSDVLCAPLPTDLTPAAQATEAGPACNSVGGGPCALVFGNVNCGTQAPSAQLFMTNTGTQSYTVTGLTLANNTFYGVTMVPANGIVAPGGTVTITVAPNAIPGTVPAVPASATYSDTLTIATNANVAQPNFSANLTMGAAGVIVSNSLATTNWAFGTVNLGSTGFYNVAIRNAGNEDVSVTLSGLNYPSIFGLENNPVIDSNPPDLMTITGTFTPPSGAGNWADTGTLTVAPVPGAVLCQPLPASWATPSVTFTGTASNNPVVSVGPTSLPFPAAKCGTTDPAAENVTVSNSGTTTLSYSAVLGTGSFYTIVTGASGMIAGGSNASISVRPTVNLTAGAGAAVGSSPYDDDLVITIAGTQYYVPITMTVNGVVLSLVDPLNETFAGVINANGGTGDWQAGYDAEDGLGVVSGYYPVVENTGTISAAVTVTFTGFSSTYFTSSPLTSTINPNANQSFTLSVTNSDPRTFQYVEGFETFTAANSCNGPLTTTVAGRRD